MSRVNTYFKVIINIFIGSGSGQAVAVMPVMIPVADMLHINRQVVVLAYNLGDGLCNYIMPTASVLIGPLGLANLSYIDWMKKMKPLFITWFVLSILIMMLAQLLQIT